MQARKFVRVVIASLRLDRVQNKRLLLLDECVQGDKIELGGRVNDGELRNRFVAAGPEKRGILALF